MSNVKNTNADRSPSNVRRGSRFVQEMGNGTLITFGALAAGMGIKGFLQSSHFIDGGVTGVSMLAANLANLSLSVCLLVFNLPFIALGYRHLGLAFAIRSALGIAGLSLAVAFVPYPDVTPDPMLTAVFGGLFIGAGIGLAVRGKAVLDGTEILALLISKRSDWFKVGDVILVFNVLLFLTSMKVLGTNEALYSILTYFAATKTLDFVLYGLDELTAVTIVSDAHAAIRERIISDLGRGVTVYRGYGGKTGEDKDILYCVITRLEIAKLKGVVREIDRTAFIVMHPLASAEGGVLKTRAVH